MIIKKCHGYPKNLVCVKVKDIVDYLISSYHLFPKSPIISAIIKTEVRGI